MIGGVDLAQTLMEHAHQGEGLGRIGSLVEHRFEQPLGLGEVALVDSALRRGQIDGGRRSGTTSVGDQQPASVLAADQDRDLDALTARVGRAAR